MSLTAAASGFVVFLLSVSVIQGQDGWGVTYSSTKICALKGSTVDMSCTYRYPSTVKRVQNRFWFRTVRKEVYTDLNNEPGYSGRVKCNFVNNDCTLRITDLRESDSAEYKFRFITNQERGKYSGSPGVTLSVRVPEPPKVQVHRSGSTPYLKCVSSYDGHTSFIWFKNGEKIHENEWYHYPGDGGHADKYTCAVRGCEKFPSPPVYAPIRPSVSVSPSAEILEGSSVTLTCSSDANPAAKYTWYKKNGDPDLQPLSKEPQLVFSSIQSSDSGEYYCTAENELGRRTSEYISINVTYAPKLPSVSVSPSAEIVEGSSVNLTCSSDANPAANYTWYKENEDSPKASGQIFTITDFRAEHSGNYSCEVQNRRGRNKTTVHLTVAGSGKSVAAGTITVVLLAIISLSVFLWIRKKRASRESTEAEERPDDREQGQPEEQDDFQYASVHFSNNQADNLYSNIRPAQPRRHVEQQEVEYAAVRYNSASTAPRARGQGAAEDPAVLYSTVNKTR